MATAIVTGRQTVTMGAPTMQIRKGRVFVGAEFLTATRMATKWQTVWTSVQSISRKPKKGSVAAESRTRTRMAMGCLTAKTAVPGTARRHYPERADVACPMWMPIVMAWKIARTSAWKTH
jgi:hypothetical protein